jgi:hypothetical protein
MKRTIGFYIEFAAAVVGLVSAGLYGSSMIITKNTYTFIIAAAAVAIISSFAATKNPKVFNWGAPLAACLMAAGIAYSITVMSDPIGYFISGLYTINDLKTWITFMIVAGVSWLLYMIAGFTGMVREA